MAAAQWRKRALGALTLPGLLVETKTKVGHLPGSSATEDPHEVAEEGAEISAPHTTRIWANNLEPEPPKTPHSGLRAAESGHMFGPPPLSNLGRVLPAPPPISCRPPGPAPAHASKTKHVIVRERIPTPRAQAQALPTFLLRWARTINSHGRANNTSETTATAEGRCTPKPRHVWMHRSGANMATRTAICGGCARRSLGP